ncbi:MAG: 6,7-dimethyl-8-ribityllumazine synthase [Rikenellaceae bacterium]|jgi:6,7-dimethyl-8-ribityllumazine synthase|nr:6,7-dimethyl-8-ribityllumazine synthase [Rikenellaceae bacterium]
MIDEKKNLSAVEGEVPSAKDMKIGIAVAHWNNQITDKLLEGAVNTLLSYGCPSENIIVKSVPGTFELTLGAQLFAENTDVDAVIALGCVIQGDTRHFDFICQSVTEGLTQLTITWDMPMIFGVLTTNTMEQALDRCGGRLGNKGDEAAITAIRMVALQREMRGNANGMMLDSDEGLN